MLNPATDNVIIEFNHDFFDNEFSKVYDEFLFHMNGPIKNIKDHIHESIQEIEIPGFNLNVIETNGLPNATGGGNANFFPHTTINRQFPGTSSQNDIIDSKQVNITFRNTILNWSYIFQVMEGYYRRKRIMEQFAINITLLDSAQIPMLSFRFSDCFTSTIPGLSFGFNSNIREVKTVQSGFTFNKFDVKINIPEFAKTNISL